MNIDWSEWEVVRKIEGKEHEIIRHRITGEVKFVKFLRENNQYRLKELVSELIVGSLFQRLGLGLNPILVTKGKPAIFMDYKLDARLLKLSDQFVIEKVELREYTAAVLFLVDRFTRNTNRGMRFDQIGWEDIPNGKIKIFSFDNGHTLGYGEGNEALDSDADLDANFEEQYKQHLSFTLAQTISPAIAEQVLNQIKTIDFGTLCEELNLSVVDTLAPTDDERNFLKNHIQKIAQFLERRKLKTDQKTRGWLGIPEVVSTTTTTVEPLYAGN